MNFPPLFAGGCQVTRVAPADTLMLTFCGAPNEDSTTMRTCNSARSPSASVAISDVCVVPGALGVPESSRVVASKRMPGGGAKEKRTGASPPTAAGKVCGGSIASPNAKVSATVGVVE